MPELITRMQAAAIVGLTPQRLVQLAKVGKFPRARKAGPARQASVRFIKSEVEQWLKQRYGLEDAT